MPAPDFVLFDLGRADLGGEALPDAEQTRQPETSPFSYIQTYARLAPGGAGGLPRNHRETARTLNEQNNEGHIFSCDGKIKSPGRGDPQPGVNNRITRTAERFRAVSRFFRGFFAVLPLFCPSGVRSRHIYGKLQLFP